MTIKSTKPLFLVGAVVTVMVVVLGYERKPCTRIVRPQFQLPDCYVPDMNPSMLLSSASFLMSHNAATGYIKRGSLAAGGMTASYAKNQVGTAYDQLNDGARALDLRPKYLANGTVIFHHGSANLPVTLEQLVSDAVRWCNENDDELVLLLNSELGYESKDDEYDNYNAAIEAMATVFNNLGVPYLHCNDVYGLTVAETMEIAALPSGGFLVALDGHNRYASFCGKNNWVPGQLVTCYPQADEKCTDGRESKPMAALKEYILASANNEATNDYYTLGPPANLYDYPFNEIQAFWQVDQASATAGLTHLSTILNDNIKSKVNEEMVQMIYNGKFQAISLFAVDNVALHGNALLSVLRTTCGQSQLKVCGRDMSPPKMEYFRMSRIGWTLLYLGGTALAFILICRKKDKRLLCTFAARGSEWLKSLITKDVSSDSSRHEDLLHS
jgi:hypothetical protein